MRNRTPCRVWIPESSKNPWRRNSVTPVWLIIIQQHVPRSELCTVINTQKGKKMVPTCGDGYVNYLTCGHFLTNCMCVYLYLYIYKVYVYLYIKLKPLNIYNFLFCYNSKIRKNKYMGQVLSKLCLILYV